MMKKLIYCAAALTTALFAGSCQRELLETLAGETTVTYTVELPSVATKAATTDENRWIGDGNNVDQLIYQIWKTKEPEDRTLTIEEGKTYLLTYGEADVENGKAKFSVDLVNKQNYTILFWAQVKDEGHYDTTDLRDVKINTPTEESQNPDAFDESRAAFFGTAFIKKDDVRKAKETVILRRPFGQINLGTVIKTQEQLGYILSVTNTEVTVYDVATEFNVATGTTLNENQNLTFAAVEPGKYKQEYPNSDKLVTNSGEYNWISMNYVFVPANKANIKVGYKITTNHGLVENTISNVPAQINYKTNIVGNLLTSKTEYEVILDNTWTGTEEVKIWDGETISEPAYNPETKTYKINNGDELAWVAAAVNGTLPDESRAIAAKTFKDEKIVLAKNINLGGNEWVPIGVDDKRFSGTFDGAGHVIESFKITTRHGDKPQAALFGNLSGNPTFQDLTIEKAKIVYPGSEDFYGAALIATAYGHVTIKNVTVKDCYISGNNKVAGLLAHDGVVSSLNIDNCLVDNCVIESLNETDGGNVGGLVGLFQGVAKEEGKAAPYGEHIIKNSSVKNTTINAINSRNAGSRSNGEFVACISGKDNQTLVISDCTIEDNTFRQTFKKNEGEENYVSPYGDFVGGDRNDDRKCTVIVDGVQMIDSGLTKKDNIYHVSNSSALVKAFSLVTNDETVQFEENIEQTDGILITDKNIEVDLNQKTFTVSEGASTNNRNFKINGSSVVTITNGTMIADGDYSSGAYGTLRTEGSAKVTLTGVKLYNYRGNGLNVKALSGTTVTINDTEIYSQYGGGIEAAGGTIELNNVKVEQKGMYTAPYNSMAISVNGGGTVTVNSGTYSTECLTAEEANNQGTSHGPWCAGVLNSGGTLIIKDGTFSNDNFGDNSLATYARGLLLADTGAKIKIEGGSFTAVKSIIDIQNNLGDASKNPTATISGGTFNADPRTYEGLISIAEGYIATSKNGIWTVSEAIETAKIGNTTYYTIDDAIANWTNNTTLTLLRDVELSDVVTLKSTEHHILNLGTYTLTAASGKHAIEITCNGLSNATYALTVNADANNPGGITATGKSCIYYKKSDSTKDRPIILINNGVFTGSYSINSTSNGNTNCPQIWINGGVFNSYMNLTKNMLKVSGGTFHGAINCTGDSSAYREIKGGRFKSWQFMTADAPNKFWVGSGNGNYNVGVYVDDEGYLVVGGPVITELSAEYPAVASNYSKWSNYLKYSSAATYGLFYKNSDMAIAKHGAANVTVYDPNANKDEE